MKDKDFRIVPTRSNLEFLKASAVQADSRETGIAIA